MRMCLEDFSYDVAVDYKGAGFAEACGTASVSSGEPWPTKPRVERHLLNKAARMQGFLVWDYEHRYEEAVFRLAAWVRGGRLRYREEILEGISTASDAIAGLYRGKNLGKRLIRLWQAS